MSSRSLNIGMPINAFLPTLGGASIGLHNIASRLAQRGHRPTLFVPYSSSSELKRRQVSLPYALKALPPSLGAFCLKAPKIGTSLLGRYFAWQDRKEAIDVWHCTYGFPNGVGLIKFAESAQRPHLIRCVGIDIQKMPDVGYGFRLDPAVDETFKAWMPKAQKCIAITKDVEEEYLAAGIAPERIIPIPNGVDLDRIEPAVNKSEVRASLSLPNDKKIILSVGRFHPKKNFERLVDLALHLKKLKRNDCMIALVGIGVSALNERIATSGLGDMIRCIEPGNNRQIKDPSELPKAPSDEIIAYYQAADIFVFPSFIETFGIVLIEAMAAGLPVVSSDAPGCREVIRFGKDGLMIENAETSLLADAALKLLDDEKSYKDYRARSLARAQDFSWETITDQYEGLYARLMDERPVAHE